MNMISTGAFLLETDASTKQNELVKKLTSAWEKKNSKKARAGGASLMALSLAACGGEDDTPFSAADVSAAEAAAATAALTGADGTVYASVDAAVTSNDAAVAEAAKAEVDITTDNQAAIDAAVAAVDLTTDNATAIADAVSAATGGSFASIDALYSAYDSASNPAAVSLSLTTSADILSGTTSNDTFTGTTATYAAGDVIADSSSTDNDTFNITVTANDDLDGSIVNVENINVLIDQFTNTDYTMSVSGVSAGSNVTFDVVKVGSTVSAISVSDMDSITLTTSDDILDIDIDTDADVDLKIVAGWTGTGDEIDITDTGAGAMDTLHVTSADDVDIVLDIAGNVDELLTVVSAGDASIDVIAADAVNVTTADEALLVDIDGAETLTISSAGTGAGSTVKSSITTADTLDTINISGNGAATTLTVTAGQASVNTINISGDQTVQVEVSGADHDALAEKLTVVDSSTAGTSRIDFTAVSTSGALDTRGIGADEIELSADFGTAGETLTVASGQKFVISTTQNDAGTLTFTSALASASTNTLTLEFDDNDDTTNTPALGTATTIGFEDVVLTNFATVNVVLTDNALVTSGSNLTATGADIVATGAGTFTNATGDVITADSFNGSDMTGKATLFITSALPSVTTGAGADAVNIEGARAAGYTITTGAGNDTINFNAISTAATIDAGAGTDTVDFDSSVNLTSKTLSLTGIEIVDLDADGTDSTSVVQFDSADVTGKTFSVTTTNATKADTFKVVADGATVDLGGLSINTALTTVIDADAYTAVAAVNITGTNDADDIDMTGGVGSTASGGGGVDNILGGAGADTIDGGAGGDTLGGAGGADTITGGEGADTITAGNGADTIYLAETTAARDIIVTTSTLASAKDTIHGFAAGSASTKDEVDVNYDSIKALATDIVHVDDSASVADLAADFSTITVSAAFDGDDVTDDAELVIVGGDLTFSSSAAVADALEDGGSLEFTLGGDMAIGDAFLVLYSDGSDSHLTLIEAIGAASNNGTFAEGELIANDILTFVGISDATSFDATNFDLIT
jgi:hypothetical protein